MGPHHKGAQHTMSQLTDEQLQAAESMDLNELRAMALKEAEEAQTPNADELLAVPKRDEKGRFVASDVNAQADEVDNSGDGPEVGDDGVPSVTIYRKEIENGDGSFDVYEAESLEELVDKIAEGKRNANKKIREFITERKEAEKKNAQVNADEEYVTSESLKKAPRQTVEKIVLETLTRQQAKLQEWQQAQERFVATHPRFIVNPENGARLVAWLESHGYAEPSYDGLEKAYQDLSKSGLLELKAEGANAATEAETQQTDPTGQSRAEATQRRSPRTSSTIRTTNSRTATPVNVQPTEDEAYALPLDQLRALADQQLANANRE